MRLKRILLSVLLMLFAVAVFAQRNSWDGWMVKPRGEIRMLNFFVNIIYNVHPEREKPFAKTNHWNMVLLESLNQNPPDYLLRLMDTVYNPNNLYGCITRLYGESSFDELQITGDFVIVNIKESRVLKLGSFNESNIENAAVDFINEQGGLQTMYGHNDISYYDNGSGKIGFIQFFFRNITKEYGGDSAGSGYFSTTMLRNKKLLINGNYYPFSGIGTAQCVGTHDVSLNPTGIVQHEISHSFFGPNSFHTSGGNHRRSGEYMPFLPMQCGYGLMGGSGSTLVSCNGYERWRMHWQHESNRNANDWWIVARDIDGNPKNADISKEDGTQTFILRDFVTYGDAVRIKLPYKDSESSSNQYIWIENHQSGRNNKLDFLQFANESDCRPQQVAGVYAYYQIGRDILSGANNDVYYANERDNLRMIPAEGYWNYSYHVADTVYNIKCINWATHDCYYSRDAENPFCGTHDMEGHFSVSDDEDILSPAMEKPMWRKCIGRIQIDSLVGLGDTRDMFCTHTNLNMGTNPSTCNTKTFYNSMTTGRCQYSSHLSRNTQTTYLTGLGIEITPFDDGNCRIDVRWDDYTITNNAIWTGSISLKERAVLAPKMEIWLTQNLTVAQPMRDDVTGLFAKPTVLVCEAGSEFVQEAGSIVNVEEKSTLVIEAGAAYRMDSKSKLKIDRTSHLVVCGRLIVGNGAKLVLKSKNCMQLEGGEIVYE
ncbi:MAG: hypothetical protein IKJ56_02060 [Bacteroidales bacterium]|nr:hypothetical protein [Bacteroidales bacterium]